MSAISPHTVARSLGGDIIGRNRVLVPGPGHSKLDRSLLIKLDPAAPNGFQVSTFSSKDDWRACRDYVSAALGLSRDIYQRPRPGNCPTGHPLGVSRGTVAKAASEYQMRLWSETIPATGTLAEKYLAGRALMLPDGHEQVLRFHPSCPFGPGTRYACMVALYRDIRTNQPKAIHRTALTIDGKKIDRKVLGPKAGCAIKLSPDEDVTEGLTIAEGIETALAGMALNFRPTWALGDAGGLVKFVPLSGIECLTILVDNDASGTGQASALECSRRWTSEGREVFRVVPAEVGQDMADVVRGRAAA